MLVVAHDVNASRSVKSFQNVEIINIFDVLAVNTSEDFRTNMLVING